MAILDELNKAKEDLQIAESRQKMMVDANKILRLKNKTDDEKKVMLRDFMPAASISKLFIPDYLNRTGFPSFSLTNNNANIRRLDQRVKDLEKKYTSQVVQREEIWDFDGGYFENNYDLDRVQIFFDSIPDASMRSALKGSGWNWSPTNKAWQRKITDAAIYSAKRTLPNVVERKASQTEKEAEPEVVYETPETIVKDILEKNVEKVIDLVEEEIQEAFNLNVEESPETIVETVEQDVDQNDNAIKFFKFDEFRRGIYYQGENFYVDVDGVLHDMTPSGEPNTPLPNLVFDRKIYESPIIAVNAPIVLLWSEDFDEENQPFQNLEQLQDFYKTVMPSKNGLYTKTEISAFDTKFRIDITKDGANSADYHPLKESLLHYMERRRPNYDWKSLSSGYISNPENNLAIEPSTYANQYVLNKAIESWLMENVGSLDAALSREYTTQEKIFLKAYSGYGGLKDFGPTGVDAAFEFYTPKSVIQKMWALAYKHGYQANGSILEPSVGIGEFLQFANPNTRQVAYEISLYSAMITKILYPTVEVNHMPFEKQFIKSNYTIGSDLSKLEKFDLVIGNPPYGNFQVLDSMATRYLIGMGEVKYTGATNYVEYFIQRSLDLLKPGGLLVFIVGAELKNGGTMFLDGPLTPTKRIVHAYGELLDAYRLPNSIFERTGVTSDILVIKKR